MKTVADKRLFWFLKEGAELDLENKADLDLFVQQVLTRGAFTDVKRLFAVIGIPDVKASFGRIAHFLPREVRRFWEDALGDFDGSSEEDS